MVAHRRRGSLGSLHYGILICCSVSSVSGPRENAAASGICRTIFSECGVYTPRLQTCNCVHLSTLPLMSMVRRLWAGIVFVGSDILDGELPGLELAFPRKHIK